MPARPWSVLPSLVLVLVTALAAASCALGFDAGGDPSALDDSGDAVTLDGAALARELAESPARAARAAFRRVGIQGIGPAPHGVEIAFSDDGQTWSRWRAFNLRHLEVESDVGFVGEVEVPDGAMATHYRLRGTRAERPSAIALGFFPTTIGASLERGEDPVATERIGTSVHALSIGSVQVQPRSTWGARAPRCSGSSHSPKKITIHHTATPNGGSPEAQLRQMQSHHQDVRGWCDIGYHFLISRDGRIWEGRDAGRTASHVQNNNTNNLGISFIGNYMTESPTEAQIDAASRLIAGLEARYGISGADVFGHRDFKGTDCPGTKLYQNISTIVARAGGQGGGGEPPPDPPPAGTFALEGVVHEADDPQKVIAGASVTVGSIALSTNERGWYHADVPAGTHDISVTATGFLPGHISRTVGTETGVVWASVGLSRQAETGSAALQGIVYRGTDTSDPVAGATVFLPGGRSVVSDEHGFFRFEGLAPASYVVTASLDGVGSGSVTRDARNGEIVWASVGLTPGASVPGAPPAPGLPTASCDGLCGSTAPAPGSSPECFCDSQCETLGDCCADRATVCESAGSSGSCQGRCHSTGATDAGCYCDASCEAFGDCCTDFGQVCGPPPSVGQTCAGNCGSSVSGPAGTCYCDSLCSSNGDCCTDYAESCSGGGDA